MIHEIVIYRYRTQFTGDLEFKDGGTVSHKGEATTDLDPGSYTVTVDKTRQRYVVDKPKPKSQQEYRFTLDVDGVEDVFKLAYSPRVKLTIEGSGPKTDPFKEMLYGMGPDVYADDPTYIDNVTGASFDVGLEELTVTHKDESKIKVDLDAILEGNANQSGVTVYTYFRDLRTNKIMPNVWDHRSVPNIADMAEEIQEQRVSSMIFEQAIAAGITIMGFMLASLGAMKAIGSARPGASGGGGGGRRWRLRKPPQADFARGMAQRIRAAGQRVVVNIGGEGEEAGAINLNIKNRLKTDIPNLVEADGAEIGELFSAGSVDEVMSNQLPPNTLNWVRIVPGAHRVLRPGGRLIIRFRGAGQDRATILPAMQRVGFREIEEWGGAGFTAVK